MSSSWTLKSKDFLWYIIDINQSRLLPKYNITSFNLTGNSVSLPGK
jgi:hypothetical protein